MATIFLRSLFRNESSKAEQLYVVVLIYAATASAVQVQILGVQKLDLFYKPPFCSSLAEVFVKNLSSKLVRSDILTDRIQSLHNNIVRFDNPSVIYSITRLRPRNLHYLFNYQPSMSEQSSVTNAKFKSIDVHEPPRELIVFTVEVLSKILHFHSSRQNECRRITRINRPI